MTNLANGDEASSQVHFFFYVAGASGADGLAKIDPMGKSDSRTKGRGGCTRAHLGVGRGQPEEQSCLPRGLGVVSVEKWVLISASSAGGGQE